MLTKTINYLLLTFFTLCLLTQPNYCQNSHSPFKIDYAIWLRDMGVDTTSIDSIKASLNGEDLNISGYAAGYFADRKMTELIPEIRLKYYTANNLSTFGFDYLNALYKLNAPDIRLLLNNYVDSVYTQYILKNRNIELLEKRYEYSTGYTCRVIEMLANLGDYSRFSVLVDFIENEKSLSSNIVYFQKYIGHLDQSLDDKLFSVLQNTATKNSNGDIRASAVYLLDFYTNREGILSTLLSIAINDSIMEVRDAAEYILIRKYRQRREVFDLQVQRLYTNNNGQGGLYSQGAALARLVDFNYPEALVVVKDAIQNVIFINPEDREMALDCYDYYEPPRPDSTTKIVTMIDSLTSFVSQVVKLNWLGTTTSSTQMQIYLITAKTKIQTGDSIGCYQFVKQFQNIVNAEYHDTLNSTPNFVTIEGWKYLYYNAQYILDRLPKPPPPSLVVSFKNSSGNTLFDGSVQYYDGTWKDAINYYDGTFGITTTKTSLSVRMTYGFASQTKNNVMVGTDTVVFQTINASVQLKSSTGSYLDTGSVQFYAGAWRTFGNTTNGIATKELLPVNYSFRMTYGFASKDTAQDINSNPTVIFQTVNAQVQLKNSQQILMDTGTVQYYSSAWRTFGTTINGVASKELLPNNYSFRMSYGFASNDKAQNIGSNPIVLFQTVHAQVQLKNSLGTLIDAGAVQYYSGAWRTFGATLNGIAAKELLPNSYPFRMTHAYIRIDKTQNIGADNTVTFSTVPATVRVTNLQSSPVNNATVTYYSGAWRSFGTTANGETTKELLPANIQFRAKLGTVQQDKTQNLSANPLVEIQLNVAQ